MADEEREVLEILEGFEPDDLVESAIYLQALEKVKNLIEKQSKEIEELKEKNKELEKQYKILEVEKVRYNIQYLESSISQIPDTVMVYHSIKRDIETLKEQKIKLEKELQELLKEE